MPITPCCRIAPADPPRAFRVTIDLPGGGPPITLRLLATTCPGAVLSALELAGPDAKVRRCTQQGEW